MTRYTCFISYEQNDIDNDFLLIFKNSLETDREIQVILDKVTFSIGDDITKEENKLYSSDAIIIFLSENYKKKILEGKDSGVFREYTIIKELLELKDKIILPILYSGTLDSAVPEELKYILFSDISSINPKIHRDLKKVSLYNILKSKIRCVKNELKNKLDVLTWSKDPTFKNMEEEYKALFINTNAVQIPKECIIKTKAYESIKNQSVYFILGRKGSGKTTLLETFRRYDSTYYLDTYKMTEPISAEHLRLEFFYEKIISKFKSCIGEIDLTKVIETFWKVFLFLYCVYDIAVEIEKGRIKPDDKRYETFKKAANVIREKFGRKGQSMSDSDCRMHIFTLASELIYNQLDSGIFDNADVETLITSVNTNFNANVILSKLFGKIYERFCKALKACTKKIMIALDGFDPYSEDFRRATNLLKEKDYPEYELRKRYEILFYRELMILISNIKDSKIDNELGNAFSIVDFCIIIPQDRYDEIREWDRDSIKRKYCCLGWDAYDLLLMLVKRLEYYYRIQDEGNLSLIERFNFILANHLPNVPTEITVDIDGHNMPMHIFNYILRLSFWRPRDILTNFAVVLKVNKELAGESNEVVQSIIKKLLIQNVREIIDNEFIKEYKNVYSNLDKVLHGFEKKELLSDFKLFYESLSTINIESVYCDDNNTSTEKLYLLYKMGVIGLYYDKMESTMHGYSYHVCFIFNEGLQPLDDLMAGGRYLNTRVKVIFNPIFLKYLELKVNTKELIMNFSPNEIVTNHISSEHIRRI